MTGSMIVNNLAGLMMLTSLFVISVKSYRLSCGFYACQSLVLVSIFATLSCLFAAEQLLIWSASAFITKVLLVPLIMTYAARNIPQNIPEKALFGPAMMALLAALIVLLCAFVVQPVKLPMATGLKPALAVALGHFLLGLLCIVSQRNILRQIFGYCLMENGSHLVLALLILYFLSLHHLEYILYSISAQSQASVPPAPECIVRTRFAGREQLDPR